MVISGPVNDASGQPSRNLTTAVAGGNLTVRDLVFGSQNARVLRCDNATKCLNPTTQTVAVTGIEKHLSDVLVGSGPSDPNSVLFRLVNGTASAADATTTIGRLGNNGSMLLSIAEASPPGSTAAYEFFDEVKSRLAFELAVIFVSDVIVAVDQAISAGNYETAHAEEWRRNDFARSIERINSELATIGERTAIPAELRATFMQTHDYLVRNYSPLR